MDRAKSRKLRGSRGTGPAVAQRDEDRGIVGWLRRVFDHPVRRWDGDIDADVGRMPPVRVVQHLTWLLSDPITHLEPLTSAQIAQGLWYLLDNSCSNYMFLQEHPYIRPELSRYAENARTGYVQ